MKPIYIYVKKTPDNYFYLGKTIHDPFKYRGSGLIWKRHLKKHGYDSNDIETFILHETFDKNEIKELGIYYSNLFDIVNKKNWSNLRIEDGNGGDASMCPNYKKPPIIKGDKHWTKSIEAKKMLSEKIKGDKNPTRRMEVREKIRQKALNRKFSPKTIEKFKQRIGEKNGFFNKKHNEETKKVMKEKANGRYSLNWFIHRYGEKEGQIKYELHKIENLKKLEKGKLVPRKEYKCPVCGLVGKGGNMKRYHFENCNK